MIKAILWDNDGVLVDTEPLYFAATREVLGEVGIILTEEMYRSLILVDGRGAWHLAEERGVSPKEIERLRTERNEHYGRMIADGFNIIDGAVETLGALYGRFVMGVVTSSRKDHFDLIHRSSRLLHFFDFVITSEDFPKSKPHPDPYLLAVERCRLSSEECLAVEDSERGLISAKAAGIHCFIIPTPLTRHSSFGAADAVLESIREVPNALRSLQANLP